jgi:hypothetical protein
LRGFRRSDHADLHRIDADVADTAFDLRHDDLRRYRMHRLHAQRILRGDRGNRGHRVAAEHGNGLDIRLDTRAAAAVGPGNDEDARRHNSSLTP